MIIPPESAVLMDKICDLWVREPRIPLKDICAQLGLSRQTVLKHLRRARTKTPPDPRAARRLPYPSRHMSILLDLLEKAHPGSVTIDAIRDAFWPIGKLPANWRAVIVVIINRVRAEYGAQIANQGGIVTLTGYLNEQS